MTSDVDQLRERVEMLEYALAALCQYFQCEIVRDDYRGPSVRYDYPWLYNVRKVGE